jgi:hypothetical protein
MLVFYAAFSSRGNCPGGQPFFSSATCRRQSPARGCMARKPSTLTHISAQGCWGKHSRRCCRRCLPRGALLPGQPARGAAPPPARRHPALSTQRRHDAPGEATQGSLAGWRVFTALVFIQKSYKTLPAFLQLSFPRIAYSSPRVETTPRLPETDVWNGPGFLVGTSPRRSGMAS